MARLRRWVALTFDRSDVIDMADDKRGTMVLKWSAPLPQSSKWLNAVLTETCVIDIRPNGRYRLQVFSPRISFGFTEAASLFDEMGLANPEAEADMRLVNGLAQRMYGGSLEWPVDEQLDQIVAAYLEQLNSTQQFRNERDRERGRATDEYRTAEHQWRILHDVRNGAESYNTSLVQSLSRALNTSDDF